MNSKCDYRRLVLSANDETRKGRFYNKTLRDIDKLSDGETDDDLNPQESDGDDEKPSDGDEDGDSQRKRKAPFVPPEDIDLGDKWTLRDIKVDANIQDSDSEPGSDPESEGDQVPAEDDIDAERTAESVVEDVSGNLVVTEFTNTDMGRPERNPR